jgi:hypothetical protein
MIRKTNRTYGSKTATILNTKGEFTAADFGSHLEGTKALLAILRRQGKVRIVRPAQHFPNVYEVVK